MIRGYTALAVIGRGAGSTIHKVRHNQTCTLAALKQVKSRDDPEGRFREQILVEHRVGRAISHPNVRQVYELHRVRKRLRVVELCLLLEFLDGVTLDQAGIRDPIGLLTIFKAVAAGLGGMHQAGYVHADIKPNNVMLTRDEQVKIFDLGQSCRLGRVKQRIQGTPDFIAPEQVMKLPVDERTDVFNLGTTMYWCLTGKGYPTRLKSRQRAGGVDLNSARDAESPRECNPDVPSALSALVMDCCRNSPANRPRMAEVLKRLTAAEDAARIIGK